MRLAADENFNNRILHGLRGRIPNLDVVRIQDTEIIGAEDDVMLEWSAQQGRVVLSHDVNTVSRHAYDRLRAGLPMPGVFLVPDDMPIGPAIDDLFYLIACGFEGEYEGQVRHLPLR